MKWTDKMDEALAELRKEGVGSTEIAHALSKRFGCDISRNAVIGRATRKGMPSPGHGPSLRSPKHNSTWNRREVRKPRTVARRDPGIAKSPRLPAEPIPAVREDDVPRKTFAELDRGDGCCRFRVDKPLRGEPYGFCGKEALAGMNWCEGHARRIYINAPEVISRAKEAAKEKEMA